MSSVDLPRVHLCIIQPAGYVHSLGFLDQARFFRHQFRRLGASVSLSKNRLRHGAINFVFGAHLGFDAALRQSHCCVFVNLEQLGARGAQLPPGYLDLLRDSVVVDYDADNVPAYSARPKEVPCFPLGHAPYLAPEVEIALEERPIDLLFIGSMNDRRRNLIARIEQTGVQVSMLDSPVYGPERDSLIVQSKAMLNLHFYEENRFEQTRAALALSLGTPVVSERGTGSRPSADFDSAVSWFDDRRLEEFFAREFATPSWFAAARAKLRGFAATDTIEQYAAMLGYCQAQFAPLLHRQLSPNALPVQPRRIHLGSGKDYRLGWLNLDILEKAEPDLLLDLSQKIEWPLRTRTAQLGPVELHEGQAEIVYANNVLEHVPDLPALMTNCLALLQVGGHFVIEVPYEHASTAWQDPTHVRALNENSWLYYTDWFWYLGWFEHRFEVATFEFLDAQHQRCDKSRAAFMQVVLKKIVTTLKDRTTARAMRADFCLGDDPVPKVEPPRMAPPAVHEPRAALISASATATQSTVEIEVARAVPVHRSRSLRIASFTMMRNERAILGPFTDQINTLADYACVADHQSTDGSDRFVRERLSIDHDLFHVHAQGYPQDTVATLCSNWMLGERSFDWILFLDCDEFLPFRDRAALEDYLQSVNDADVVSLPWQNICPTSFDGGDVFRRPFVTIGPHADLRKIIVNGRIGEIGDGLDIQQGAHSCSTRNARRAMRIHEEAKHALLHLPLQSRLQIAFKLAQGNNVMLKDSVRRSRGQGYHWVSLAQHLREGRLDESLFAQLALGYPEASHVDASAMSVLEFDFPYVVHPYEETQSTLLSRIAALIDPVPAAGETNGADLEIRSASGDIIYSNRTAITNDHALEQV